MIYFLAGLGILALILVGLQSFVRANPADLARGLKTAAGLALLAVAALFGITGRLVIAVPLAGFGLSLIGFSGLFGLGRSRGKSAPSPGQTSRVRSALVEMELDHDSGQMRGQVLAGPFAGHWLDDLSQEDLKRLWMDAAADPQSQALVEAYLDRRLPGWRVDFQADGADRHGGPASAGTMTDEEAYEILGLAPDAGDAEIRAAFHRLMKGVHPDRGGSSFLAAKLNEAKDRLLRRH